MLEIVIALVSTNLVVTVMLFCFLLRRLHTLSDAIMKLKANDLSEIREDIATLKADMKWLKETKEERRGK